MKSNNISYDPDFSRTIKVKCYDFEEVLNFKRLKNIIYLRKHKALYGIDDVVCNISKTMTQTIFDTMTNANNLF